MKEHLWIKLPPSPTDLPASKCVNCGLETKTPNPEKHIKTPCHPKDETSKSKKSCTDCVLHNICVLRTRVNNAITESIWMLNLEASKIYKAMAEACTEFKKGE